MCQYFSPEEMKECCKDPSFCAVCMSKSKNVIEHCCEDCRRG